MTKEDYSTITKLLKKEVVPAIGCTEPVAVALAAAKAAEVLKADVGFLKLFVSPNLFKNGAGVGIPGTGMVGLPIAAALGATGGKSKYGLEVLKEAGEKAVTRAKKMIKEKRVTVEIEKDENPLYVKCICMNEKKTHESKVIIKEEHSNISLIERDNKIVFSHKQEKPRAGEALNADFLDMKKIMEYVDQVDIKDILFMEEAVILNNTIGKEGLTGDYGLSVGKTLFKGHQYPPVSKAKGVKLLTTDVANYAVALTAGAADARMSGCILPAMSNTGSGNQGINATLPIVAVAQSGMIGRERLIRAVTMSHLVTIHIKSHMGRLSALCGVVAASTGVSSGLLYLFGGELKTISNAIKNLVGNLTGMICDGAKPGCALKVASGVQAAITAVLLAFNGKVVSPVEGIVEKDVEKTLQNLAGIGAKGMKLTDEFILDIMVCK